MNLECPDQNLKIVSQIQIVAMTRPFTIVLCTLKSLSSTAMSASFPLSKLPLVSAKPIILAAFVKAILRASESGIPRKSIMFFTAMFMVNVLPAKVPEANAQI